MPAAVLPAIGKMRCPKIGQQQQHAAGEPPAGLHEHQRGDVRALAHVAQPFDEVGHAGERLPARPAAPWRPGVESNRVRLMNQADTKNDAPLMTNAMLRPASAVTRPPIEAPTASMAAHVALESALAGISSSLLVTFGIVAVRAGSKNAEPDTVSAMTT